jgi:hypothetical protein
MLGNEIALREALAKEVKALKERPVGGITPGTTFTAKLKGSTTSTGPGYLRHAHGVDGNFSIEVQ